MSEGDDHKHMLVGDAYEADNIEYKALGHSIKEQICKLKKSLMFDSPDSKMNTVAFMKPCELHPKVRNAASAGDKYISYPLKKNFIRIIESESTQKSLLRGHQATVLDVRFSKVESSILCSVDEGKDLDAKKASVFIWEMTETETELKSAVLREYNVPACIIEPSPVDGHCFAIASDTEFGLIHGLNDKEDCTVSRYEDIRTYGDVSALGTINDISFSSDGRKLAVALTPSGEQHPSVLVWVLDALSNSLSLSEGSSKLSLLGDMRIPSFGSNPALAVCFISVNSMVTVVDNPEEEHTALSVWDATSLGSINISKQQVQIPFDLSRNYCGSAVVTQEYQPSLLYSLNMVEGTAIAEKEKEKERFLVLGSRKSSHLACFACSACDDPRLEHYISHAVMADVKVPMQSIGCSIVSASDRTGGDEHSHLEIVCYQENGTGQQAGVQEHHIPTAELCPPTAFANKEYPFLFLEGVAKAETEVETEVDSDSEATEPENEVEEAEEAEEEEYPPAPAPAPAPILIPTPADPVLPPPTLAQKAISPKTKTKTVASSSLSSSLSLSLLSPKKMSNELSMEALLGDSNPSNVSSMSLLGLIKKTPVSAPAPAPIRASASASASANKKEEKPIANANAKINAVGSASLLGVLGGGGGLKLPPAAPVAANSKDKTGNNNSSNNSNNKGSRGPSPVPTAVNASMSMSPDMLNQIRDMIKSECATQRKEIVANVNQTINNGLAGITAATEASIQTNFVEAFEKSIVPAFQSGVQEMFQQVQTSFEKGMTRVQKSDGETAEEIKLLREAVGVLEKRIEELGENIKHAPTGHGHGAAAAVESKDPMELLEMGMIPQAVEAALEMKNMEALLSLLSEMTPALLTEKCSRVLLLCTTQQLAADLSTNEPTEGLTTRLDWIKNMVVHILFNSEKDENPDGKVEEYVKIVMDSVKDCILSTSDRLQALALESENPGEYKGALTDLKMLHHMVP